MRIKKNKYKFKVNQLFLFLRSKYFSKIYRDQIKKLSNKKFTPMTELEEN